MDYHLTNAGMAVMITSITAVVALAGFCLWRVLTLPPAEEEYIKGPLEIDTGDTDASIQAKAPQADFQKSQPNAIQADDPEQSGQN